MLVLHVTGSGMRSYNLTSAILQPTAPQWLSQMLCRCTAAAGSQRSTYCVPKPSSTAGQLSPAHSLASSRLRRSLATAAATQPPSSGNDSSKPQFHTSNLPDQQPQQQQQDQDKVSKRRSRSSDSNTRSPFSIDDPQLLVGDCVALVAAALYRQIAAIVLSPSFAGWFAPLSFNPLRFAEFANFAGMLVASWVVAATLTGGYSGATVGAGVPGALRSVCKAWLVAMPICAAHLVLVTASESQALVGDNGFADVLPLAAHGPGEPLGTAAALLGLMAMWRSFYAVYLDSWVWASARDVAEDAQRFREALATVALLAAGCSTLLQVLQLTATLSGSAADGVDVGQMLLKGAWGAW